MIKRRSLVNAAPKWSPRSFWQRIELEERPLPYLASLINLGVNEVAARLNAVSPTLAQTFLGTTYKPGQRL